MIDFEEPWVTKYRPLEAVNSQLSIITFPQIATVPQTVELPQFKKRTLLTVLIALWALL